MELTKNLKKHFCKNYGIPIKIFDEPVFSERIELLDELFDTKSKLKLFKETLKNFKSEQDYFEQDNKILTCIKETILQTKGYEDFNNKLDYNYVTNSLLKYSFPSNDIYKDSNLGKTLVSIDLKKANFQALRAFDASIFNNKNTWEEYVRQFTQDETKINSKHYRQVVFGMLNPKRTTHYEKFLLSGLIDYFEAFVKQDCYKILSFGCDEIVIEVFNNYVYDTKDTQEKQNTALHNLSLLRTSILEYCQTLKLDCRVDVFYLTKVGVEGYKKNWILSTSQKNPYYKISHYQYPFLIRELRNESITDNDRVFLFERNKAKFIDNPLYY